MSNDRYLLLAVAGWALFMLIGAFAQLNLIPYGMEALGLSQEQSGGLFLVAALGIGFGAFLAGRFSGPNVELGLVPLGSLGLCAGAVGLGIAGGSFSVSIISILLFGIGGGFFIVPLRSIIQLRAPRERLGQTLATSGFLGWMGVLLAALMLNLFSVRLGLSAAQGFMVIGTITLVLCSAALIVLPDFLFASS